MTEDGTQASHWLERLPIAQGKPLAAFAATCGLIAGAYFLRVAAAPWLPPGFPYVPFFPAVLIASFLFGAIEWAQEPHSIATPRATIADLLAGNF